MARAVLRHRHAGLPLNKDRAGSVKAVVLESFGLAGFGCHARDEYVEIDSIAPCLYLASRLLMDIGPGK